MQALRETERRWSVAAVAVPVACLLIMCAVGVASPLAKLLALRYGVDPFHWVGTLNTISVAKVEAYRSLGLLLTALAIGTCIVSLFKGARLASLGGLAISAAVFTPPLMLASAVHPVLSGLAKRFNWQEVSVGVDLTEWEPGGAARMALRTFADVQRVVPAAYSADAHRALASFGSDSTLRRAAFYTVLASHWWGPGNVIHRSHPGCVRQNEATNHEAMAEPHVTFRLYRDSAIACCDDFSHLLMLLLNADDIPNRIVVSAGHAFNEATIGGRQYVLDAMNAMVVSASWETVNHGVAEGAVRLFPLAAAGPNRWLYRSGAAVERMRLITLMLQGGFTTTYVNDLPTFFRDDPLR